MTVAAERPTETSRSAEYWAIRAVGLFAAYVITGRLGLVFAENQQNATLFWAPTGFALGALILYGRRLWPVVFASALTANLLVSTPLLTSLGISVGNTLEAVVGAWLVRDIAKLRPDLARLRDVTGFFALGAGVATLISATNGVFWLSATGIVRAELLPIVWLDWWLGDAAGAVVVTPLVLVGLQARTPWRQLLARPETWAVLALSTVAGGVAFAGVLPAPWKLLAAFCVFPLMVWAGLRLGPRGAVLASSVVCVWAVAQRAGQSGPFSGTDELYVTWAFVITIGAVALLLAAAVAEREQAERAQQIESEHRQQLETQLTHSQRLESLGVLAGGIAHDFNNLLTTIQGNAELLSDDLPQEGAPQAMLQSILSGTDAAAGLCRQMLAYAGRGQTEREFVDLIQLTRETCLLLQASMSKKVRLHDDLGDLRFGLEGDVGQLRQVVMNVIMNAFESFQDESGTIRLTARVEPVTRAFMAESFLYSDCPAGTYQRLVISDDGPGMDRETVERVFDPFFTTKFDGHGLGLAAVAGIVRGHGGAIKVHSEVGVGTTFELLFPQKDVAPRTPPGPQRAPAGRGTVLLADDNDAVRDVTQRMLEGAGYQVVTARDGAEAVEQFLARRATVSLIVMDVSMPELSGPEALARIRELAPGVPSILVSGFHDSASQDFGLGVPLLNKPFRAEALHEAIARAMAG